MSEVDESSDESGKSHWDEDDDDDDDEDDDDYDCDTGEEEEEEENGRLLLAAKMASVYSSCGVDSASNRNKCEQYFLRGKGSWCVGLTALQP
jgi:hypothetical protein